MTWIVIKISVIVSKLCLSFICVAAQDFIEAVDAILVDDSYELQSPVAYGCRKAAELLHDWIKKSENKSDLESVNNYILNFQNFTVKLEKNESW